MSSYLPIQFKTLVIRGAVTMLLATGMSMSFGARATEHFVPLTKIFPIGKCSPVIPNFEVMVSQFAGGELTEHKIQNDRGEVIETITIFINKNRDQWAIVGSKRDEIVIFCLYASGNGQGSVNRRTINPE